MRSVLVGLALPFVFTSALATGGFQTDAEREATKKDAENKALMRRVGGTYWVRPTSDLQLVKFTMTQGDCAGHSEAAVTVVKKFKIVDLEEKGCVFPRYRVEFEDGQEAWLSTLAFQYGSSELSATAPGKRSKVADSKGTAAAPKAGVSIGMSKEQVLKSSWGRPSGVNKTHTSAGTTEQWVYGGGNYLYFRNGILEAVQN